MAVEISQRELRNDSGRIMRSLRAGDSFILTSNGEPVGELSPLRRRRFIPAVMASEIFRDAPPVDAGAFFDDLDDVTSQDALPRA